MAAFARALAGALALVLTVGLGGCASTRPWGSEAALLPSLSRLRSAAVRAATDPMTWVPAAGSALFLATGWDDHVSDWASDRTPIFGSREAAQRASDDLRRATEAGMVLTALAAPSGTRPCEVLWNKAKGFAVEGVAEFVVGEATIALKDWTDRERPDGSDRESFPSGHSSGAAAAAALGRRNVDSLLVTPAAKTAMKGGFIAAETLTAWARVEGEKHFPSDVMAGVALGNFVALFLHDAFLRPCDSDRVSVGVVLAERGPALEVGLRF